MAARTRLWRSVAVVVSGVLLILFPATSFELFYAREGAFASLENSAAILILYHIVFFLPGFVALSKAIPSKDRDFIWTLYALVCILVPIAFDVAIVLSWMLPPGAYAP